MGLPLGIWRVGEWVGVGTARVLSECCGCRSSLSLQGCQGSPPEYTACSQSLVFELASPESYPRIEILRVWAQESLFRHRSRIAVLPTVDQPLPTIFCVYTTVRGWCHHHGAVRPCWCPYNSMEGCLYTQAQRRPVCLFTQQDVQGDVSHHCELVSGTPS